MHSMHLCCPTSAPHYHFCSSQCVVFPTWALFIHAIFVTSACFVANIIAPLIFKQEIVFGATAIHLVLYLFDVLVMQARMLLHYRFAFVGTVFTPTIDVIAFLTGTRMISEPTTGIELSLG